MKIYKDLLSLLEEVINELDDETVENARKKRAEDVQKALSNFAKMRDEGTPEEAKKAMDEWTKAGEKLCNIDKLRNLRGARQDEEKTALAKFKEKLLNRKPQTAKEYQKAADAHNNAQIDQYLRNKLEKSLAVSNECLEDLLSLVEEFINELDDETVKSAAEKRQEAVHKAHDEFLKTIRDKSKSGEEVEAAALRGHIADEKLRRNKELTSKRDYRIQKKVEDFKNKLLNKRPQTPVETQRAGSEHDNAIIDQHYRNKLEKALQVSNECLEEIFALVEGNIIDFKEKRREKILDRNAHKFADMVKNGELEAVRILPNGEFMGDPHYVKKLNDIKKENEQVMGRWEKNG